MAAAAQPPCPAGAARIMLTGDVMLGKRAVPPLSVATAGWSGPVLAGCRHHFMYGSQSLAGRAVDQIMPYHCSPELYEGWVKDARQYVQLAVAANGPLPQQRDFSYPWGMALPDMQERQPHARVINLETAVTSHLTPWPHKGINYRMHPGNIPTLTAAGIDVACLANNHGMDWGREGLLETLDAVQGAGIQTAGAGRDLAEAEAPAVVSLPPDAAGSPARLLVWAIGHDSSGVPAEWAAKQGRPGVFPAELSPAGVRHLAELVAAHKRAGDIVLVSVHWGSNWGYSVSREQRWFAHALIDQANVDVVHGHSSHHAKGAEVHRGHLILYGAGDLISDYEGISNYEIEAMYPKETYRDDIGALWYADVDRRDGTLRCLTITPTRLRKLSLTQPEPEDVQYLLATLDMECRKLGGSHGVRAVPGGRWLELVLEEDLPGGPEE
ncbi:hypothetical protein ABPG75_012876 [Micractinium tetrahymenae]